MKLDLNERWLWTYDHSLLDEEVARWVREPGPPLDAEDEVQALSEEVCACRRHPSGAIMDPRPTCFNCRGTGSPISNEVHKYVFDGKGNFSEVNPGAGQPEQDPSDAAELVKFR